MIVSIRDNSNNNNNNNNNSHITRIEKKYSKLRYAISCIFARVIRTLQRCARDKRVTGHVSRAAAHGQVIDDVAFRVNAACARARIATLAQHARPIARAIVIDDAFRSAARVRIAEVLGRARADPVVATGVLAARRRIASVRSWWC